MGMSLGLGLGLTQTRPARTGAPPPAFDADALAYIQRVEGPTGDNQALEPGVREAINAFVVGAKADGIWDALKASAILAGARTLNGALQPLVGPAPTNFNFVSADYNRVTGLKGNGTTKVLDSNRNNTADPQNSQHIALWNNESVGNETAIMMGVGADAANRTAIVSFSNSYSFRSRNNTASTLGNTAITGFIGLSRGNAANYNARVSGSSQTFNTTSAAGGNENIGVFYGPSSDGFRSSGRFAFYSIGEHIDLEALEAALRTLFARAAFSVNTGLNWQDYDPDIIAYINAGYAAGGTLA